MTGEYVHDMQIGVAAPAGDGNIRIHLLAEGRGFLFDASPSAAAALAGRIAEALAKNGRLIDTVKDISQTS